jgi:hypothetical protein
MAGGLDACEAKSNHLTCPFKNDQARILNKSNAQSHRIRVQIGGLGAEAYSGTPVR